MKYTHVIDGKAVSAEALAFEDKENNQYWPVIRWSFPMMHVEVRCVVFRRFDEQGAIEYAGRVLEELGFSEEF